MESALLLCLGLLLLCVQAGSSQDVQTLHSPRPKPAGRRNRTFICPQAIFALGNSLSDTGELSRVVPNIASDFPPYGETYFHRPTGRFSDGRLVIDFIALAFFKLVLPPYFDIFNVSAVGANFTHGVNAATAGATARNETLPLPLAVPWNLPVQVDQILDFIARALNGSPPFPAPEPPSFSKKGLYHIEIGGDDLFSQLLLGTPFPYISTVIAPEIASNISAAITRLHEGVGAKEFIVWNIPPVGCTPFILSNASIRNRPEAAFNPETGCLEGVNALVNQTNTLISAALQQLRVSYKNLLIFEADVYDLIYNVQENPQAFGFTEGFLVCCGSPGDFGYNFNLTMFCGLGNTVLCSNPAEFVWWDGIHFTDALYRLVATEILNGTILSPPVNIVQQCNLNETILQ